MTDGKIKEILGLFDQYDSLKAEREELTALMYAGRVNKAKALRRINALYDQGYDCARRASHLADG